MMSYDSYNTRYRWDVFISYAHLDNQSVGDTPGWVTDFARRLKIALGSYLGAPISLFFDEGVTGGNTTLDQLEKAASDSAVLIGIGSPAYAQRDWLKKELNAFCARAPSEDRLFLLEYLPIGEEKYPPPMDRRIYKRFWRSPDLYETPIPISPSDAQFRPLLLDVAKKIEAQLKRLRNGEEPPPPSTARRILIAQTTDDLTEQGEEVRRYLEQFPETALVLPEDDYPQGGEEFRKAFANDLAKADIFVQLLGIGAGRKTKGLDEGYTRYQLRAAQQSKKTIIQWRHPTLDLKLVRDDDYKTILTAPEVTVCSLEEFKASALRLARTPANPPPEKRGDVFVNADRYNLAAAESVMREFTRAQYSVELPKFGSSSADNRAHLNAMLSGCGIVIFVNGSEDRAWFETQKRLFDVIRPERKFRLNVVAVCTVPPAKRPDRQFLGEDFDEIDCSDEYDPARIRAFISGLHTRTDPNLGHRDKRG